GAEKLSRRPHSQLSGETLMLVRSPIPKNTRPVWDNMIERYGELALLRQPGKPDRWIKGILGQFSALERMGGVSNPSDMKALVSVFSPDTGVELDPPPSERDTYVTLKFDGEGNP